VGNQNRHSAIRASLTARRRSIPLEQRVFRFRIERRGRLVQNQQQRLVPHKSARASGEFLLLSLQLDKAIQFSRVFMSARFAGLLCLYWDLVILGAMPYIRSLHFFSLVG
jgi:hypothetical protein